VDRAAVEQLPAQQGAWVAGSAVAALALSVTPLWAAQPELATALALSAGAACVDRRRGWAAPAVAGAIGVAGLLLGALGGSPVLGSALAAGVLVTWLVRSRAAGPRLPVRPVPFLDLVNGGLAALLGAAVGGWLAAAVLAGPALVVAPVGAALTAWFTAQGLIPSALRFDARDDLPTPREIRRALEVSYRAPVFRALQLYRGTHPSTLDRNLRSALAEVARWVYQLQVTRQARDTELASIDPDEIRARIAAHRASGGEDARDPRAAAAKHLERLLAHRAELQAERDRTVALLDYALAYLEEARAGLAVARDLPGDQAPEGLSDVLLRLRGAADESHARRKASREIDTIGR
jgi:hypothetical protein